MKKLGAIVLAAGLSRRMGKEKILLSFGKGTVLERVLGTLSAAGVQERVVVVRPDLPEAAEIARRSGSRVAVNPHPEEEMLLSIRIGREQLAAGLDAFFVWPADHPAVTAATLLALASEASPATVSVPVYRGRRGHPPLVGSGLAEAIAAIPAGEGLSYLWRLRPELLHETAVEDRGVILDINTPGDYEEALRVI